MSGIKWFGDSHKDDDADRAHKDEQREHHDEVREHKDAIREHHDSEHSHSDEQKEIALLEEQVTLLKEIRDELRPPARVVARFIITQQGDVPMPTQGPLTGIAPGLTGVFTAQPVDASGNATTVASGVVPVWTSDDPTDVVTANADGLGASVAVASTATAGAVHTLSVAQPDGSANSPVPLPILGPATQPVASFVISQVS